MTPEERERLDQKQVAYYASSVDAWYNTSLERDKSLLTLSAGGIGLLITLLTTVGLSSSQALILYIVAIACFIATLIAVLIIFDRNGRHIEDIICKDAKDNSVLGVLDKLAFWAFVIGVVFTAVIGITAAIHSLTFKEQKMANDTYEKAQATILKESFNGTSKLQPSSDNTKSFNGVSALQPQPVLNPQSSTSSATSAAPTSSGTATTQNQDNSGK